MLYIHRKSATPIDPWPALYHGGANNLGDESVPQRFLVLCNADILQRDGVWHYIFEFDARNSLELSALAQAADRRRQAYPNDIDWKSWLGDEFTIISAAVRDEILHLPESEAHTGAVITNMRRVMATPPPPGSEGRHWWRGDIPEDFLLALPHGV
jgi:hypothetical protein